MLYTQAKNTIKYNMKCKSYFYYFFFEPHNFLEFTPALNHHEMPQQTPGVTPTPPSVPVQQQQQQQQSKEFNTASLCRLGQETVQDIVSRTQEVFQTLKQIQVCILNVD